MLNDFRVIGTRSVLEIVKLLMELYEEWQYFFQKKENYYEDVDYYCGVWEYTLTSFDISTLRRWRPLLRRL